MNARREEIAAHFPKLYRPVEVYARAALERWEPFLTGVFEHFLVFEVRW